MLLTEFTAKMFLKSAFGDISKAIDIAHEKEKFYEKFKDKNAIANSRYRSAQKCFFELFDMQTDRMCTK